MLPLFALTSSLPKHMADQLNFYLNGAIICIGTGLLLLIAAVIVLKMHGRKAGDERE